VCWWNEYDDVFGVHFGVLCDPMVVEIRLEANNLRGQLPTELAYSDGPPISSSW
jgi:hypothetical protein